MQSFLTSFSVSSNRKRRSSGHIFQGRFKAQLVEDECYRSRLSRYIHLNPIRTQEFREVPPEERADYLYQFQWSSYHSYLGIVKTPDWLDCQPILSCWGKKKREQIQNYMAYVGEGLRKDLMRPFDETVEQSIIGSPGFVDRVKRKYLLRRLSSSGEEPALVQLQQSYSLDEVIGHIAEFYRIDSALILKRRSTNREARQVAMYCACKYCRHKYTLTELARRFSVSVSGLTQARNRVTGDSHGKLKRVIIEIGDMIAEAKSGHN